MIPQYFALLTIPIGILGSFLYIRDTILGKTKPNRISWIFWTLAPFVGTYVGYKSGVSLSSLAAVFMAGFTPFLVVLASFFNKNSYWKTTTFDILCGILSLIAIIIWVTTKNGIVSLFFAILADFFAGIPTLIKSWKHSETEMIAPYLYGNVNSIIAFLVIIDFNFLNFAFPLYLLTMNTLIILGIKRKKIFK